MRSDDDQFASRQVASSTLLRNTSLLTPVPYRSEVFDMRPFASMSLYLSPSGGTAYPCYATIEWWNDQAMTFLVRVDKVAWTAAATIRDWNGIVPCRADWATITFDAGGAGSLGMIVSGQSRTPGAISQQLPTAGGGTQPFALFYAEASYPVGSTLMGWIPPWFGDVEINVGTTAQSTSGSSVFIDGLSGSPSIGDDMHLPLNGLGNSYAAPGTSAAGPFWYTRRIAMTGSMLAVRAFVGVTPALMRVMVQPVTGL